jgi:hypothetical protein
MKPFLIIVPYYGYYVKHDLKLIEKLLKNFYKIISAYIGVGNRH